MRNLRDESNYEEVHPGSREPKRRARFHTAPVEKPCSSISLVHSSWWFCVGPVTELRAGRGGGGAGLMACRASFSTGQVVFRSRSMSRCSVSRQARSADGSSRSHRRTSPGFAGAGRAVPLGQSWTGSWSRGLVIGNKGKEELSSCSFVTGVDDHARRTVDLPQRDAAAPTAPRGAPCPHRKYQRVESPGMAARHSIGVGSLAGAARVARVALGDLAGEQMPAPMRPLYSNDAIGTAESRRDHRKKLISAVIR